MQITESVKNKSVFSSSKTFWLIISFALLSLIFGDQWFFKLLLGPVQQFETIVHEGSHALACIATGGSVSGLTIVSDGQGHGGLTFCRGGIPFIYSQAGYIGETLWGCLLIALARFPRIARSLLIIIGISLVLISLILMPGTIFSQGRWLEGLGSMGWGLAIAAIFIICGTRLPEKFAHIFLLFIAVQASLSSIQGMWVLFLQSFGFFPNTWSDATNMQKLTGIPAFIWGSLWSIFSISMLSWVLWLTYKVEHQKKISK